MKLDLVRFRFSENATIGKLAVDGVFECNTLEDVVGLATGTSAKGAARQFAAFRMALLSLKGLDETQAYNWQDYLKTTYPNTPITRAADPRAAAGTHRRDRAGRLRRDPPDPPVAAPPFPQPVRDGRGTGVESGFGECVDAPPRSARRRPPARSLRRRPALPPR